MPNGFARVPILAIAALALACAPAKAPQTAHSSTPIAAPRTPPSKPRPVPAKKPFARYATLELAGAPDCHVSQIALGAGFYVPGFPVQTALGFGPDGGLAAWEAPEEKIAFRALASHGTPRAAAHEFKPPRRMKPRHVVAIDRGFVVLADTGEWMHTRWFAQVADAEGKPVGQTVELDLEHRYIQDVTPDQGRAFVVLATRALMVPDDKQSLPSRWLSVTASADGKLDQKPKDLALGFPMVRALDQVFPLELDAKPAWLIERGGAPSELIRDGAATHPGPDELAKLGIDDHKLRPKDRVDYMLDMDATGIRFHRLANGHEHGNPTALPAGAGILAALEWSGTQFVMSFTEQSDRASTASLAAIDCRK